METATAERDLFDEDPVVRDVDGVPMTEDESIAKAEECLESAQGGHSETRTAGILANPAPAHTRISDPATSFDAAASVKPSATRAIYRNIICILGEHGPSTDPEIEGFVQAGKQSPSGLRTRRKELQVADYIEYAGYKRKLASGRYGQAWTLTAKGASVYQHWSGNQAITADGKAGEG